MKEFRKNIIDELDNLKENNPSKCWTLLNDLSRDNKTTSPDIANITWFNYFQELNYNKLNAPNFDIKKDLKRLEEEQIFSELDFKITDKEIIEGIFSLKNKKSSGMDMILNEILKSSQSFLLNSFNKTFNFVLSTSSFPSSWANGFIVPIYKSGPKDDPTNYRGITIGSALGKLFAKILNTRLENFLFKRNIIRPEQVGFCKNKRTSHHMFALKTL